MSVIEKAQALKNEYLADESRVARSAQDYIIGIALRELSYSTHPNDAESLLTALSDSGQTLEDYQELLETLPEIAKLKHQLDEAKRLASQRAISRAKLKQEKRRAEARLAEAEREHRNRDRALQCISDISSRLADFSQQFPCLFDATGNLVPEVGAVKIPAPPPPPATRVCEFCEGKFVPTTDERFCGYLCSRDAAELAAAEAS